MPKFFLLPVILSAWLIDERQILPLKFFYDFLTLLNFTFDSRDLMTLWMASHPVPAQTLERTHLGAPRRGDGACRSPPVCV